MILPSSPLHTRLALLTFLTIPYVINARVAIEPLSSQQFTTSFRPYLGTSPGGCSRSAPNGVSMMNHVLDSLGGANAIAQTVVQDLPTYATQTYVRGLLYLFFGITFLADHEINPDPGQDNQNAYNNISSWVQIDLLEHTQSITNGVSETFTAARQVFVSPNPAYPKPRYRCLEDYASYYQHAVGSDHKENMSAPLIAEMLGARTSNDQYYPGLMYVYNVLDGSAAWYPPLENNPPGGGCGQLVLGSDRSVQLFTNAHVGTDPAMANALYGITACAANFNQDLLLDLGTPAANGGMAEIEKFLEASDLNDLHELMHLVSLGAITDIDAIQPPANDWTSRDWAQWSFAPATSGRSYGFMRTVYLGLARPVYARLNADNLRMFAGCMYFTELECLGQFQSYIQTKRDLPFPTSLSHRAIEKIRTGKFDLTKDLPMDADLEERPDRRSLTGDEDLDVESSEDPLGYPEKHSGRFKDINAPTEMYG